MSKELGSAPPGGSLAASSRLRSPLPYGSHLFGHTVTAMAQMHRSDGAPWTDQAVSAGRRSVKRPAGNPNTGGYDECQKSLAQHHLADPLLQVHGCVAHCLTVLIYSGTPSLRWRRCIAVTVRPGRTKPSQQADAASNVPRVTQIPVATTSVKRAWLSTTRRIPCCKFTAA